MSFLGPNKKKKFKGAKGLGGDLWSLTEKSIVVHSFNEEEKNFCMGSEIKPFFLVTQLLGLGLGSSNAFIPRGGYTFSLVWQVTILPS
jgi:hypothetical protein